MAVIGFAQSPTLKAFLLQERRFHKMPELGFPWTGYTIFYGEKNDEITPGDAPVQAAEEHNIGRLGMEELPYVGAKERLAMTWRTGSWRLNGWRTQNHGDKVYRIRLDLREIELSRLLRVSRIQPTLLRANEIIEVASSGLE